MIDETLKIPQIGEGGLAIEPEKKSAAQRVKSKVKEKHPEMFDDKKDDNKDDGGIGYCDETGCAYPPDHDGAHSFEDKDREPGADG